MTIGVLELDPNLPGADDLRKRLGYARHSSEKSLCSRRNNRAQIFKFQNSSFNNTRQKYDHSVELQTLIRSGIELQYAITRSITWNGRCAKPCLRCFGPTPIRQVPRRPPHARHF